MKNHTEITSINIIVNRNKIENKILCHAKQNEVSPWKNSYRHRNKYLSTWYDIQKRVFSTIPLVNYIYTHKYITDSK